MASDSNLIDAARVAQRNAHAPYSDYVVGAALLTESGEVYSGCNIENANFANSLHAEEVALGTAVAAGHREFDRIAVSSDRRDGVLPCGMCRQTLVEFCNDSFVVLTDHGDDHRTYSLGSLLPDPIAESDLR